MQWVPPPLSLSLHKETHHCICNFKSKFSYTQNTPNETTINHNFEDFKCNKRIDGSYEVDCKYLARKMKSTSPVPPYSSSSYSTTCHTLQASTSNAL